MLVTVNGYNAWLAGRQSWWRRIMTRKGTLRSMWGWGVAAAVVWVFSFVWLYGEGEGIVTAGLAAVMMSILFGMLFFLWEVMKSRVKPGPEKDLFYELTTPIWNIVMVPSVEEKCDEPLVKQRIDQVFRYWRRYFEPFGYANWLLVDTIDNENEILFDLLYSLALFAEDDGEMRGQYDKTLARQVSDAQFAVEQRLIGSDEEYIALEQEWNRLQAIRVSA